MESGVESLDSIIAIGKEFAFEGLDPNSFKGQTADEYRAFKIGYEAGIKLMQERESFSKNDEVARQETGGIKK